MIPKAVATIFVVALFAVGCSSNGEPETAATNEDGTEVTNEDGTPATDENGQLIGAGEEVGGPSAAESKNSESGFDESVAGDSKINNRTSIPVQRVESNGNTLTVFFEMGSQKCFGVNAEAEESDTEIEISLWSGELANAAAGGCGVGVFTYQTTITLDKPVGDRRLVAGDDGGAIGESRSETNPDDDVREIELDDDGDPDPAQFVGLNIEVAIDLAEGNALKWRVIKIDGEPRDNGGSANDSLSFEVENDTIVAATWS